MKFELFKSPENQQWYWRFVAANGKSIAIGGEGYHNRSDAVNGILALRAHAATAVVYEMGANGQWFVPS